MNSHIYLIRHPPKIEETVEQSPGSSSESHRQDMSEGCGAHGKLTSVNIVKPHHAQASGFRLVMGTGTFWKVIFVWKSHQEIK